MIPALLYRFTWKTAPYSVDSLKIASRPCPDWLMQSVPYQIDQKRDLPAANNPFYKDYCGTCHFAYQPGLLPSDSWELILNNLEDHFGETVELDPEIKIHISGYLNNNSANLSPAKISRKIVKSIGNAAPLRITQTPYFQSKHHEIRLTDSNRERIGSLSNCMACHSTAEDGIYDDDNARIPR